MREFNSKEVHTYRKVLESNCLLSECNKMRNCLNLPEIPLQIRKIPHYFSIMRKWYKTSKWLVLRNVKIQCRIPGSFKNCSSVVTFPKMLFDIICHAEFKCIWQAWMFHSFIMWFSKICPWQIGKCRISNYNLKIRVDLEKISKWAEYFKVIKSERSALHGKIIP